MTIQPAIAALQSVADALGSLGVEFYIGGSIASAYHGQPRATIDVDIIADLGSGQAPRLVKLLGDDFYADTTMILQSITNRSSFNLIHLSTMYKIDVFIPKSRPFDQSVRQRTVKKALFVGDDREYRLASAEDTILSKLEWYRAGGEVSQRQWGDVAGVLQVQFHQLDLVYLRRWADELGVADLLERAWRQTKQLLRENRDADDERMRQ